MIIDQINLNHLRVFQCVYKQNSMTKAAQELNLTQSGVSQHIKQLEEMLNLKLFDRIKHNLHPTSDAKDLYEKTSKSLMDIEVALLELSTNRDLLRGTINIGVPIEFGNAFILPKIASFAKEHTLVDFNFTYGYAAEIEKSLLSGNLDLAVIDDFQVDPSIELTHLYNEELYLCVSPDYLKRKRVKTAHDKEFYEGLDYLKYNKEEAVLNAWFKHHYNFKNLRLNVRAILMDVEGLAKLITNGLGAGILPDHMILKLRDRKEKVEIIKGKKKVMINPISLATIKNKTHSKAVEALIGVLVNQQS